VSFEPRLESFSLTAVDPEVRGFLARPAVSNRHGLVLTHGAGSSCRAPLLVRLAELLSGQGFTVLGCDLPFRQFRPVGPPAGNAARDREGLKNAVEALRALVPERVFLGGHSYGGRQASQLCAEAPGLSDGLLLLSYPLHPPRKPEQLRTAHFGNLRTPALFVHGTRDPFGSIAEMEGALALIPARTLLRQVAGAGHELGFGNRGDAGDEARAWVGAFEQFFVV
jgi:hypothetical protein